MPVTARQAPVSGAADLASTVIEPAPSTALGEPAAMPLPMIADPVAIGEHFAKTPEAETTVTDAAEPAPTKELNDMEATIEQAANTATDKSQAYIADINGRAKSAMEKGTRMIENMNEFGKENVEAFVESGKIAAKGLESMGQDAAAYTRKSFEGATAAMKSFAAVKSPAEFFKLHSDFVRGQFDSVVAETSKNTEAMLKLAGEIAQPISNRVAIAAEKIKIAA
ncbi:phasin family protein [uncultured Sphingomonas sp.]|uniref:phasin family protein n=1 Tax=uncultured Sphingomonas sp. TaxID=158754 RepID=UPI0035CB9CC3